MLNYSLQTTVSPRSQQLISVCNPSRLLVLRHLYFCDAGACGCEIGDSLAIPKNLLSYHLKALRDAGLVQEVRCGRRKQYTIPEHQRKQVHALLSVIELIR